MRRLRDRLEDVLEAIGQVEEAVGRGREAFDGDPYVRVWVAHHLQVIGEAVRPHLDELRARQPTVPWTQIVAMRHILVHQYFGVDPGEVWVAAERDLPPLRAAVEALLALLSANDEAP